MKNLKTLFLALSIFITCSFSSSYAQQINGAVLSIFSESEPIIVYIDGVRYNDQPQYAVTIEDIDRTQIRIKVDMTQSRIFAENTVRLKNNFGEFVDLTYAVVGRNRGGLELYAMQPVSSVNRVDYSIIYQYGRPNELLDQFQGTNYSPANFDRFRETMKNASFDDDKLKVWSAFLATNMVQTDEIAEVMKQFSWDDKKLQAAKIAYDRCIDPENYLFLEETFSFSSGKDSFYTFLNSVNSERGQYANAHVTSDESFVRFMQVLNNTSFDKDKLQTARSFAANNHLNTKQIREIITKFSFDDAKLNFAKFAYNRCVDQNNYLFLKDAFSFSSSQNQFLDFLK